MEEVYRLRYQNSSSSNNNNSNNETNVVGNDDDNYDWMADHCQKLDALGWTKVFCDARPALPFVDRPWRSDREDESLLVEAQRVTGSQLYKEYCRWSPRRWYVPLAHFILVADFWFPSYEERGMPFVKEYARRTMRDVVAEGDKLQDEVDVV